MEKSIISEGKTTTEAIENGLAKMKATKDMVDIKVLEEEKRSFFSILTPRVVKVKITMKDKKNEDKIVDKRHNEQKRILESDENIKRAIEELERFLAEFLEKLDRKDVNFEIKIESYCILVNITGENLNYLIGYRGETLISLQVILTSIASKFSKERLKVLLNIENYREKREKALEELAEKIAKTVTKTKKSITLEPMTSYERKIIHSKLQRDPNVKTYSIGAEPHRKVVIAMK